MDGCRHRQLQSSLSPACSLPLPALLSREVGCLSIWLYQSSCSSRQTDTNSVGSLMQSKLCVWREGGGGNKCKTVSMMGLLPGCSFGDHKCPVQHEQLGHCPKTPTASSHWEPGLVPCFHMQTASLQSEGLQGREMGLW